MTRGKKENTVKRFMELLNFLPFILSIFLCFAVPWLKDHWTSEFQACFSGGYCKSSRNKLCIRTWEGSLFVTHLLRFPFLNLPFLLSIICKILEGGNCFVSLLKFFFYFFWFILCSVIIIPYMNMLACPHAHAFLKLSNVTS